MNSRITRRQFTGSMAAAGLVATQAASVLAAPGANERIRLGIIGVGNRGDQLIDAFRPHVDAQIAAICDVYTPYLEFAARKVGGRPFTTKDYRALLDRPDLDAVIIATPDHWHAKQCVDACAAGKDVYVEKPLSLVVSEGRAMIEAARKHKRVTQVGIHRRSVPLCRKLADLVQSGAIGKVTACRCFHLSNEWPLGIGNAPDSDPPPGLDWNMWLGPAPVVRYNENRCFYKFRWFRAFSGGQMTNFGTHWLDLIQWAIGQDAPRGVFAAGTYGNIKDGRGIPDTMEAVWDYPNGTLVSFSQYNANSSGGTPNKAWVEFRGTEGTLYLEDDKIEIIPQAVRAEPIPASNPLDRRGNSRQMAATRPAGTSFSMKGSSSEAVHHARNFLDCIKTRTVCHCPVETGHRSTVTTLVANIACDRKRYLAWDADAERFTNDEEANKALSYEYRGPWRL